MRPRFRPSSLVPVGFVVDHLDVGTDRIGLVVRSGSATVDVPRLPDLVHVASKAATSACRRLPLGGRRVELQVMVRRSGVTQRPVGGRSSPSASPRTSCLPSRDAPRGWSRSSITSGLHSVVGRCGPRAAPDAARQLRHAPARDPPSGGDTLRSTQRHRVDDFAWRRNHRFGTLVCDLERRRIVALLPDREQATAQTWLKMNGSIRIVAATAGVDMARPSPMLCRRLFRSPTGGHLMENASRGFLDAVRRSMRQVREVVGAATIDPALLTAAERIQYEGYLRREEADAAIRSLAEAGVPIRRICQRLGHSRKVWCVRSCVGNVPTSSGSARVRSTPICPGSMPSGMLAAATRPNFGAGRRDKASGDRCAWSGNWRRGVDAPSRPRSNGCSVCRRHEPWRDG